MNATETLKHEHQVILMVLDAAQRGGSANPCLSSERESRCTADFSA